MTTATEEPARAFTGGFEDRFRVTRTDGQPIPADRRYLVIDYTKAHARDAVLALANTLAPNNPEMAADLRDCVDNPTKYPSQHD